MNSNQTRNRCITTAPVAVKVTDVNRFHSIVYAIRLIRFIAEAEEIRNNNMESVFVTENPIDINLFVSECNEVQKLKIGEIFQLRDNSLSMCCVHCLREFQYFTEFSLHIQDHHYLRGDVAQLGDIKGENSNKLTYTDDLSHLDTTYGYSQFKAKAETAKGRGNNSELLSKDLEFVEEWSDEDFIDNSQGIFEPEINVKSFEKLPAIPSFIEGADNEKSNGIYCPICAKAFSAVSNNIRIRI